jgi:hypothetical protein
MVMETHPLIHDNNIYSYIVDCERRRVILHTANHDCEPSEFTDVVFHDVVAHCFDCVLAGNILFDIVEVDIETLVRDNGDLFETSWRYGWPPVEYDGDLIVLVSALISGSVRGYSISSSYGLSGWVLAGSCERLSRGKRAMVG